MIEGTKAKMGMEKEYHFLTTREQINLKEWKRNERCQFCKAIFTIFSSTVMKTIWCSLFILLRLIGRKDDVSLIMCHMRQSVNQSISQSINQSISKSNQSFV